MIPLKPKQKIITAAHWNTISATNALANAHLDCGSLSCAGFPCRLFANPSACTAKTKRIAFGKARLTHQDGSKDERIWRHVSKRDVKAC
jgi:hypothetical protein